MKKSKNLSAAILLFWFAQYVYIPFQIPYLTSIQTSAGLVGMVVGAYGISQMLLRLPIGILADCRNRHKQFIIMGMLASGMASIFRVVFQNGMGFFIGNLFSGFSSAMWISFMVLYMSFFPGEQQKATSHLVLMTNLGMLAAFTASTLFYQKLGMKTICIFGIIAGLCGALIACRLPAGEEKVTNTSVTDLVSVVFSRRLIGFSLLALIQQGVQMSTTMSFTTQIIKDLGAGSLTVGLASIIYMVSAVFWSRFASTKFCLRFKSSIWITLVFCTTAGYCVLVPLMYNVVLICVLQILPGMATGILFSLLTSEAMKGIPEEKKSTAMGCFQAIYALGITVFPVMCGKVADTWSMEAAYFVLAVVCVAAAVGTHVFEADTQSVGDLMV